MHASPSIGPSKCDWRPEKYMAVNIGVKSTPQINFVGHKFQKHEAQFHPILSEMNPRDACFHMKNLFFLTVGSFEEINI